MIEEFLDPDPETRLGCRMGALEDIQIHDFLKDVNTEQDFPKFGVA